ncbi:hypothetical protein Pint_01845 [Pistacia integerrima]|uniref:Uncharacterized protein n=1 Tax=Pistacia integerrima TaxID=434235 RepID=A0ACC0ZJW1_9ROSI|nr:hypothetical protein Pint_01845 [Pistacia integerrima]
MQAVKHQVTFNKSSGSFFDLKMATRFLVSVSVFSIMVSHYSLLPLLLNIVKLFSFSAYKTIDKSYMFLLCNGILVFIFKNSVVLKKNSPQEPVVAEVSSKRVSEKRHNRRISPVVEKKVVQEPELALVARVAEEKQVQEKNEFEDEDEEENGSLSREELNKKCDDFIRKMKELIKIEA